LHGRVFSTACFSLAMRAAGDGSDQLMSPRVRLARLTLRNPSLLRCLSGEPERSIVMRKKAQKGIPTNMTNAEANKATALAEQGAHVAPAKTSRRKGATRKPGAPKGQKRAKGGQAKAGKKAVKPTRAKKSTATPRAESKPAKILAMIQRPKGATVGEIMKATAWQAHSVRGFISTASKKHGIKIESSKNEAGDRVYRTAK
jgi:hypothetical protein